MPETYWTRVMALAQALLKAYPNWSGDDCYAEAIRRINSIDYVLEAQAVLHK